MPASRLATGPPPRWPLLTALALASACGDAPVHVRAGLEPGVPLPGLEIAALPYDVSALLDSLERSAVLPRPRFPQLEEQIRSYRRRDGRSVDRDLTAAWLATRDSVTRMSQALSRMDRHAPGYREAYARFRDLYARYTARETAREAGFRKLFGPDRDLAAQASRAGDSLRAWEREAYRPFPALAAARMARRAARRATTDSAGGARFELPPGRWWLTARLPDPENPFQELLWNVPIAVTGGLPFAVPLLRRDAEGHWRH